MTHIVLKIRPGDENGLAPFRDYPGLEAAAFESSFWVKAPEGFPWRRVPCEAVWKMDEAGRLFPIGKQVPETRIPDIAWRPAVEALPVKLPVSGMPAKKVQSVVLRPERSSDGPAPSFMRLPWNTWRDYALEAPATRLRHWYFLRTPFEEAFVMGTPVPPLPGHAYVLQGDRFLVPEGWLFRSAFELAMLQKQLEEGGVYLFGQDGMCESIPAEIFVPASRAAVRAADKIIVI